MAKLIKVANHKYICPECKGNGYNKVYNSHFECATSGYDIAKEMMNQMGQNRVNNDRIVVAFKCEPMLDI